VNKFFVVVCVSGLCFSIVGCHNIKKENEKANPMNVLPTEGGHEIDAQIYEVPTPKPWREGNVTVYPLLYGDEEALTTDRGEWQRWLQDPSLAPLPQLRADMDFVLAWCHQFAQFEPEEVGLILMNYFEYDRSLFHKQPTWHYSDYPDRVFLDWRQLRRAIVDKTLVCAGYSQLFYLIVREKYPSVRYITSEELCHARNYFEDEHWDITWLDDAGVDYNPDKIKFDFVGMQKRIERGLEGRVGRDWKFVNLVIGERP
jgi:hypothetical protein